MKTVSAKHLKGILDKGGIIEDIEKPKPKEPAKPATRDIIAETLWTIKMMVEGITACFRSQNDTLKNIKIVMPAPVKEKKRRMRLWVQRDKEKLIKSIDVEEV